MSVRSRVYSSFDQRVVQWTKLINEEISRGVVSELQSVMIPYIIESLPIAAFQAPSFTMIELPLLSTGPIQTIPLNSYPHMARI